MIFQCAGLVNRIKKKEFEILVKKESQILFFLKNRMKRIEKQNKCFSKQEKILSKKRRKSLLTLSFHSIIKNVLFTGV